MIRFIIGIVLGVLLIIFMVQNTDQTQITFLAWTFGMSRSLMYLLIFALGFGTGFIPAGIRRMKRKPKSQPDA